MTQATGKRHGKLIAKLLLIVLIFPAIVLYYGVIQKQKAAHAQDIKIEGTYLKTPTDIADFSLTDNQGGQFTQANLKGHWTFLFFGFTNCGNVCPTTLSSLNKVYKTLQAHLPDKKLPQVVLVSVDPERDTVARMNSYVKAFNPHFIGARTEPANMPLMQKQFHIAVAKIQAEGKDKSHYSVDHTADVLLVNPEGKLQAVFPYPVNVEKLAKDYQAIIAL